MGRKPLCNSGFFGIRVSINNACLEMYVGLGRDGVVDGLNIYTPLRASELRDSMACSRDHERPRRTVKVHVKSICSRPVRNQWLVAHKNLARRWLKVHSATRDIAIGTERDVIRRLACDVGIERHIVLAAKRTPERLVHIRDNTPSVALDAARSVRKRSERDDPDRDSLAIGESFAQVQRERHVRAVDTKRRCWRSARAVTIEEQDEAILAMAALIRDACVPQFRVRSECCIEPKRSDADEIAREQHRARNPISVR